MLEINIYIHYWLSRSEYGVFLACTHTFDIGWNPLCICFLTITYVYIKYTLPQRYNTIKLHYCFTHLAQSQWLFFGCLTICTALMIY